MSRGQPKTSKRLRTENPAAQLGRLGGRATAKKYTTKQRREWGKKGGRPKLPKISDVVAELDALQAEPCGLCAAGNIPDELGYHHLPGHSSMYRCTKDRKAEE